MRQRRLLLDTHVLIWLVDRAPLPSDVLSGIMLAASSTSVFVSPVSAWDIGLLSRPRANRPALQLNPDPKTWFARAMTAPGIQEAALTPAIALDASFLPGDLHNDPADRLLGATARHLGVSLVTRDAKIIACAKQGFMQVVPC